MNAWLVQFLCLPGRQLLTISGKFLRLFRVNPYALVPPSNDNVEWVQRTKLECVFSTKFLSRVQSLAVARIPRKFELKNKPIYGHIN